MGQKSNSNNSSNVNRKAEKSNYRSKAKIQHLNMLNSGKAIRDKKGKVIGGYLMMNDQAGNKKIEGMARIAPDRRWFGNTRVIGQAELDSLREKVTAQSSDPYSFILRRKKIPMALLQESEKVAKMNILETESFEAVFSKTGRQRRPKLSTAITDYASLMQDVEKKISEAKDMSYETGTGGGNNHRDFAPDDDGAVEIAKDDMFAKGQSKRIWGELYKVLDCSDVVIQVIDARNVPGTRCRHIEKHLKKNASHKQLILVLNKCDLVPSWCTRKWVKLLSKEYPTVAFHANVTKAFGKGALITLLRQFSKLHADKRQISVGIIGYPNVGKSSVINTLKGEKVCKAAPVPGETKVWQYVTLTKRMFLIDSPGVVYDVGDDETETVLKGVVRAERLKDPTDFVAPMLARLKKEHLVRQYGVSDWDDATDFLMKMARLKGKLLPNGEPCMDTVAKMMINDWQRGKLPFFVAPPRPENGADDDDEDDDADEGDEAEAGDQIEDDDDDDDEAEDEDEDAEEAEAAGEAGDEGEWEEMDEDEGEEGSDDEDDE